MPASDVAASPSRAQVRVLGSLEGLLQNIYDADNPHRARDFLITDAALADRLRGVNAATTPETLLLHQADDGLDLSLYLDAATLERLERENPLHQLGSDNLQDFCTVLEGLSHFLYVTWNAGFDRSVTPLELEMQAEVDKYVSAVLLRQQQGGDWDSLHRRLFEAFRLADGLSPELVARYVEASQLAARYCRALQRRFLQRRDVPGLVQELRRFWRLPRDGKIRRIREAA